MRFQHGDVILVQESSLPKDAKFKKVENGFVVEKGEGVHVHVIEKTEGLEAHTDKNGILWLKVNSPVKIDHEEHGIKIIQPGIYRKEIENEYDAEADETRKTQD
jgi:hypothetical protein